MLDDWKREWMIRRVLRGLARQRVLLPAGLEGPRVIERYQKRDAETEAALQTAFLRGWVEPAFENMAIGDVGDALRKSDPREWYTRKETLYRLTEGGWAALNRSHAWALAGTLLTAVTVIVAIIVSLS